MSLLLRQTSKTLGVKIFATLVGMVSMLFIYPLDHGAYGLAQFIIGSAMLLLPFVSLGLPNVVIKFFADYGKQRDPKSLLPTALTVAVVVIALSAALILVSQQVILDFFESIAFDVEPIKDNLVWILLCLAAILIFQIISGFLTNYGLVAGPTFIQDVGLKLFLPIVVLLSFMDHIGPEWIAPSLVVFYCLSIGALLLYGASRSLISWKPDFSYFRIRRNRQSAFSYGAFIALSSLGAMLAFRLDSFMITTLLDAEQNGLYFNILVMASVIDMPNKSIGRVAGPMIAKSWTNNEVNKIASMYSKSSLVNQIIGSIIFVGVLVNLEHLFQISAKPEAFVGGVLIFIILGATKLFDGAAGVNSQVLAYSDAYKYNLYFMLFLAVISVVTNYLLIPTYGIIGAAIATCISLTLFNVLKLTFLFVRYRLQPLSKGNLVVLVIAVAVAAIGMAIPAIGGDVVSIVVKSVVVAGLFLPLVYIAKVSKDYNDLIDKQVIARLKP